MVDKFKSFLYYIIRKRGKEKPQEEEKS